LKEFLLARRDRMTWLARQKRLADQAAGSREEYIRNKAQAYAAVVAEALQWAGDSGQRA